MNVLEALIVERLADGLMTAAAICVVHRGQVVVEQAWGRLDERGVPTTADTLFDLASVTKVFTLTALLHEMSAHSLSLDTPLVSVIPEFSARPLRMIGSGQDAQTLEMDAPLVVGEVDARLVTFRQVMAHTAGLLPWRDLFNMLGPIPPADGMPKASRQARMIQALNVICEMPFYAPIGYGSYYSDIALILLGEAASRLSGYPLDTTIRRRVLEPLDCKRTTFNPQQHGFSNSDIAPTEYDHHWRERRCWGEVHDENAAALGGVAGHAGLFSVAREVAILGQAWLTRDGRLGIPSALMDEAVSLQSHVEPMHGLVWVLKAVEDSSAGELFSASSYGHTGFTGTSLWVDPVRELVVALLTNRVYPGRERQGIHDLRRVVHDAICEMLV